MADREAYRRGDAWSRIEQAGRVDEVAARNQQEEKEGRTDQDRQRKSERQQQNFQLPRCENGPKPRRCPGNSMSNRILQREHDPEGLHLPLLRHHAGRNPERRKAGAGGSRRGETHLTSPPGTTTVSPVSAQVSWVDQAAVTRRLVRNDARIGWMPSSVVRTPCVTPFCSASE
jgi:hypothetical protein